MCQISIFSSPVRRTELQRYPRRERQRERQRQRERENVKVFGASYFLSNVLSTTLFFTDYNIQIHILL